MIVIVGLGNPGTKYSFTRHNVGFLAVNYFRDVHSLGNFHNKFNSEVTQGFINKHKVLLVKPNTYMNLSGHAISSIISYYKIQAKNLFVIHDDIDLNLGALKLKFNGGDAGHNGVKSINVALGNNNYYRIRVGVGRPQKINPADYVLANFESDELNKIMQSIKFISDNIELLCSNKLEEFQSKINTQIT